MERNGPTWRVAYQILVDLRVAVLPSAVGEIWYDERERELTALVQRAEGAGPWLAGVLPGLTENIQRAAATLLADCDDDKAWMNWPTSR